MLGYRVAELLDRPVTDFMPEEDARDHFRRTAPRRAGKAETYERRFRRKDGTILWTNVSATRILDERPFSHGDQPAPNLIDEGLDVAATGVAISLSVTGPR
jgi:PAS domain S-box-containing protein